MQAQFRAVQQAGLQDGQVPGRGHVGSGHHHGQGLRHLHGSQRHRPGNRGRGRHQEVRGDRGGGRGRGQA